MSEERCIRCGSEVRCWGDSCGVTHTECECGLRHYGLPSEFRQAIIWAERNLKAAREGDLRARANVIHDISFGAPHERQAYEYVRSEMKWATPKEAIDPGAVHRATFRWYTPDMTREQVRGAFRRVYGVDPDIVLQPSNGGVGYWRAGPVPTKQE